MAIMMGSLCKDNITGFTGVVVAITQFLFGCNHITLQPKTLDKEGYPRKSQNFDEQRIELAPGSPGGDEPDFGDLGLGWLVRDTVTGFTGVVVARQAQHYGLSTVTLEPEGLTEEGDPKKLAAFESDRCEVLEARAIKVSVDMPQKAGAKPPGGPFSRA